MNSMETTDASSRHGVAVWASAAWREEAVAWLDERLGEASIQRTGEVEQPHLRPWATALWAPTSAGRIWLKAAGPETAFEIGLYEIVARVAPDRVLVPLATDPERGWMLLPDGGEPLGETVERSALSAVMEDVLPQYAQLQIELAPEAEALIAAGAPDMRAPAMPHRFEEALEGAREYVAAAGEPADRETLARLEEMRPEIAEWCERLASDPVPASLDHNDLHAWNILVAGGRTSFYDWGDGVVSHPFASMLVGLGFIQNQILDVEPDDARIVRLRDAYLEPFSGEMPRAELVETLELACRVGKIARSLIWLRTARCDPTEERWQRAPFHSLAAILDVSYMSGA
jgi:Phosphotransferase enzyme family